MVDLTMAQLKKSFPFETPRARQMEELKELAKQPTGHLFQMPPAPQWGEQKVPDPDKT